MAIEKDNWGPVVVAQNIKKRRELIRMTPDMDIKSVQVLETPEMTQEDRIKNMQNARARRLGLKERE